MKKLLVGILILIAGLFLLSAPSTFAQDACQGDFDCDNDVDGSDAAMLKEDFGRSSFSNPCPDCNPCPYNMIDCGTKCVDPMTDEDFCGADSTCLGGMVCANTERCVSGVCEQMIASCDIPVPVAKTGQTLCYDENYVPIACTGTGQDGEYQKGVPWPNPRFTDNGDGTITDNLTGLIWLKNANCFSEIYEGRTWYEALSDCNGLSDGQCGLTDGSQPGDWRLPNKRELISITHAGCYQPAVPNTTGTGCCWQEDPDPFYNLQPDYYWSSTSNVFHPVFAWIVDMWGGWMWDYNKGNSVYVWPVRDPL